jgi:fucose permease
VVRRVSLFLLPIIYLGYISLGLPDGTLGVAWPQMHGALVLPVGLAGTLALVVTLLAACSAFFSGAILSRYGTGPVVFVSCALTGTGLLLVSQAHSLAWMLLAAVPLGFGAGAVDAGLNGYVARHYSSRHMNWLHACWGIGATAGPLIMTCSLRTDPGWRLGYGIIALVQFGLSLLFLLTLRLWDTQPEARCGGPDAPVGDNHAGSPSMPANSEAGWLSTAVFALYVGTEATAGLWAATILVESRGMSLATAGICTAAYYGSITGGRLLAGLVANRWGNRRMVRLGLVLGVFAAVLFTQANTPWLALAALVALGLGFAPVYPCMMHEVPKRFAPEAVRKVVGRQTFASYIGGAFLTAAAGWVASQLSPAIIAWFVVAGTVCLCLVVARLNRIT